MTREMLEQLNFLSKKYMGSKRRWQRMVEKGAPVPLLEDKQIVSVGEDGTETIETKKVPVMQGGKQVMKIKYFTAEEIYNDLLSVELAYEEAMKKATEEQAQQDAATQLQKDIGGSAT